MSQPGKKMNIPKQGKHAHTFEGKKEEKLGGVLEPGVSYSPSNGTSFILRTAAAVFRLRRCFILPWTLPSKILEHDGFSIWLMRGIEATSQRAKCVRTRRAADEGRKTDCPLCCVPLASLIVTACLLASSGMIH